MTTTLDAHRLFDRIARLYDAGWLQRALYLALQDRVLGELRALRPGSVVDVGCGTGIFAARLAESLTPVTVAGCDLSAGMLGEARVRSSEVGWIRGDSTRLPLRAGAVEGVVCTQAFHFFDQPAAWAEFRRVLAPGGHALVGMINPKSEAASGRFTRLSRATTKTRMTWPTASEMHRLATGAGFDVTAQHEVEWRFRRIAPLVLTVARAPAA